MGSEDLFHTRKAKKAQDLQRKNGNRQVKKKVLIVCEGETEVSYFQDARTHYKLNALDVEINNKGSSDPTNIVNFAKECYQTAKQKGNPFDLVFCVFDKDVAKSYATAVQTINAAKPKNTFFTIGSVPCFEYWLLLHFTPSTSPFSNATQVKTALKKHLPTYTKNQKGLFNSLLSQLSQAKTHATAALKTSQANNTDNPSTQVHELIEKLERL